MRKKSKKRGGGGAKFCSKKKPLVGRKVETITESNFDSIRK